MPIVQANVIAQPLANDPGAFLRQNVVTFYMPDGISAGDWSRQYDGATVGVGAHRPHHFSVEHVDAVTVRYRGNLYGWYTDGRMYQVEPDGGGDGTAYFLPWKVDSGYSLTIGANASLFFNAMMNGCSFGWSAGNGIVRVAHHNIQDANGATDNGAMLQSLSGYAGRYLRNDYRLVEGGAGQSTVIGVRVNGQWQIWAQIITSTVGGTFDIQSVRRLL
ncbi:hypothetical protein F1643_20510 [Azospirillum sp. INR13]|uniref:hypothetical protein n=1 Tax=Azospirillum sp. INR13 TaxID=2596919 RepID=UPI001892543A|nr:hypothetical protein [Azospirillum sp. INR13]MBF5096393.1 hypothetical protein [Azospirillum sp. INR13]